MSVAIPAHRLSIAERCANLAPTATQLRPLLLGVLADKGPGAIRPARRRHFALLHQYLRAYDGRARENDGAWRAELVQSLAHIGILCKFLTTVVTHQLSELHTHIDTIYEEHAHLMSTWSSQMAPFWTVRRAVFDAVLWDPRKWSPSLLLTEMAMQRRSHRRQREDVPQRALDLAGTMADLLTPSAALTYDMLACVARQRKGGSQRAPRCGACIGCATYQANKALAAWRGIPADVHGRVVEPRVRATARLASQMTLQAARGDVTNNRASRRSGEQNKQVPFRVRMLGDRKYMHPEDGELFLEDGTAEGAAGPVLRADVYATLMVMGATLSAPDLEWTSEPGLPVRDRFWCVMTGRPIPSSDQGFYWIYTVPGAAPVVLTVSRTLLEDRERRMRMLEQGASFEQIARSAPLCGVELALFLATPPPAPRPAVGSGLGPDPVPGTVQDDRMSSLRERLLAASRLTGGGSGAPNGSLSTSGTIPAKPTASALPAAPVEVRSKSALAASSNSVTTGRPLSLPSAPVEVPSAPRANGSSATPAPKTSSQARPLGHEPGQRANPPRAAREALKAQAHTAKEADQEKQSILREVLTLMKQMQRRNMQALDYMMSKLETPGYEVTSEVSDEEDSDAQDIDEDEEVSREKEEDEEEEEDSTDRFVRHLNKKIQEKTLGKSKKPLDEENPEEVPQDVGELGEHDGDGEKSDSDASSVADHRTLTGEGERSDDDAEALLLAKESEGFISENDEVAEDFGPKRKRKRKTPTEGAAREEEEEEEDGEFEAKEEPEESDEAADSGEASDEASDADQAAEEASDRAEEEKPAKKLRKKKDVDGEAEPDEAHIVYYYTPLTMVDLPEGWVCMSDRTSGGNLLTAIMLESLEWKARKDEMSEEKRDFWAALLAQGKSTRAWVETGAGDFPLLHFSEVMRALFFEQDSMRQWAEGMTRFAGVSAWTEQASMEDWRCNWLPDGTKWGSHILQILQDRSGAASADLGPLLNRKVSVKEYRESLYTLLTPTTAALLLSAIKKKSA